ncbi:FAD-dependent oxidoreductase [Pedobacter sp. P351]|uniref:FAD-dependent oxidoreductase n=1 Tax=Pedobacter superstes TaxID=3133441 RepID=UPI0030A7F656
MSGQRFFNKQNVLKSINRRSFLLRAGLLSSGIMLGACLKKLKPGNPEYSHIKGSLKGPDSKAGHILRDKIVLPTPSSARNVKTLIIGGGISGLSAARWLKKNGHHDFELLELEDYIGGNSSFRKNKTSSYPLGAHYITLANNHDKELIDFLEESDIITHYEGELPFYNEYTLCFDPEERLLINGQWQESLIPEFGVSEKDKKEIKSFLKLTEELKAAKGNDGKYAFDIPLANSSSDPQYRNLDKISFKNYLKEKGFTSEYLLWYLEYCTKDDYGQKLHAVSAWAGLHYFSARKGKASNAESNAVITWPEGNGRLMKYLADQVKGHIKSSSLTYSITETSEGRLVVNVFDLKKGASYTILADKIILASPQYVNNKLLRGWKRDGIDSLDFNYAPWIIANITVKALPDNKGTRLCWDNVAYNTASVGYINATQQSLKTSEEKKVLTYYLPLCDHDTRVSRLAAYARTYEQWLDIIIPEMEHMHPNITENIEEVELWVWGHGMISPAPGFIWGQSRQNALKPIGNKLFFAHTDLSGISIFEEAFHHGIRAANEVLASYETDQSL